MNQFILGVIINIIAAPIIFILGRVYQLRVAPEISRRRLSLRPFLPFVEKEPLILTYGYVCPAGAEQKYSVEQGDLIALLKAYQVSCKFWAPERIRIQDSHSLRRSISLHTNILTISGPKWNPITNHFLGALGAPVFFTKTPRAVAIITPGMQMPDYYTTKRENGALASLCYATVISGFITSNSGEVQNVVICAGRTTLSTNASLLYLNLLASSSKWLEDLKSRGIKSKTKWGVLLQVTAKKTFDQLLDGPLTEDDVEIKVLRAFVPQDFHRQYHYVYGEVKK